MQQTIRRVTIAPISVLMVVAGLVVPGGGALALDPEPGEEKAIKACERRLCTMALGREPTGPDLTCNVGKTWDRDTLKKGESSSVSWGFGDARCTVDLKLSRADLVGALTAPKYTVVIPEHEVRCIVEQDGKQRPVLAKLAPKLKFKNGKADKIWLNLGDVSGPTAVKATVNMAASLEDTLGIFHRSMLKSVNRFLHTKCAERYHADGRPKDDPEAKTQTANQPAKPAKVPAAKASVVKPAPVETGATPAKAPAQAGGTGTSAAAADAK